MMKAKLRRLSVFIVVDKKYPKSKARKAESAIKELLGFRDGRDNFQMVYKPFYDNPLSETQTIQMVPGPENPASITNIINYALLFLILLAIILYVVLQRQLIAASSEKDDEGGGSMNVNSSLDMPDGLDTTSEGSMSLDTDGVKRFFDFVNSGNIDNFITLVNNKVETRNDFINCLIFIRRIICGSSNHLSKLQAAVSTDLVDKNG